MISSHALREKQQVYALLAKLMSAMKALAYAELQKLRANQQGEKHVLQAYRRVISTLLAQGAAVPETKQRRLLIAVGTERGFCGDINRRVYGLLKKYRSKADDAGLILVGERLFKFHDDQGSLARLSGALVAEDVEPLVNRLMDVILNNLQCYSLVNTQVIFLDKDLNEAVLFPLIETEMMEAAHGASEYAYEPLFYEKPVTILEKLLPEYFFATLQYTIKSALLSENHQRYAHMQEATRHLDKRHEQLSLKINQVRREKIIEEVSVSQYIEDAG